MIHRMNRLRRRREILITCGILCLLLAGCHGTKKAAKTTPPETPEATTPQPVAPQRTYEVIYFTGEAEGVTMAGQLRVAHDSAMWLSVNKVFEVARAMATRDSLFLRAPLLGYDVATHYQMLQQRLGHRVAYDDLQAIALGDNTEQQVEALARQLGFSVKIHITERRVVPQLTFPYPKPSTP